MVKRPPLGLTRGLGRASAGLWAVLAGIALVSAQEAPPAEPAVPPVPMDSASALGQAQVYGRISASLGFLSPASRDGATAWTALGQASGRIGLGTDGKAVKPELRASFATWPEPRLQLDRAWVKFRFDALRGTVGLGKLGWGPGLVLVPGDLLFESAGTAASLGSDEVHAGATWLADLWLGIGSQSFLEAMVLSPDPQAASSAGTTATAASNGLSLPLPGPLDHLAGGARCVLASDDIGFELAWAHDTRKARELIALSSQCHLGIDWYLSLREDLPWSPGPDWRFVDGLQVGAGGFGLWDLGEGFGLASRHEILIRPVAAWRRVEPAVPPSPGAGTSSYALLAYHDLDLTMPEHLSLAARLLWSPLEPASLVSAELAWAPLQALRLSVLASWRLGAAGSTWNGDAPGAFTGGLSVSSSW